MVTFVTRNGRDEKELPPPKPGSAYYYISPEEGGHTDIEAMWIAEDYRNGDE